MIEIVYDRNAIQRNSILRAMRILEEKKNPELLGKKPPLSETFKVSRDLPVSAAMYSSKGRSIEKRQNRIITATVGGNQYKNEELEELKLEAKRAIKDDDGDNQMNSELGKMFGKAPTKKESVDEYLLKYPEVGTIR